MEYSLFELEKAVYYTLTLNPNIQFSLDDLRNEIGSKGSCPDFSSKYNTRSEMDRLENACANASSIYNNVCFNGTSCYLRIADKYDMMEIEKMIRSPHAYGDLSLDKPYCAGQTIPHILCIEGNSTLLDELSKSFQINVMTKNEKGQTLLDVIPSEKQETMKTLVKIAINQMRDAQNIAISEIRSKNTDLLKANSSMRNEIASLRDYKTQMNSRLYVILLLLLLLLLLLFARFDFSSSALSHTT
jgi:hypothetical protein